MPRGDRSLSLLHGPWRVAGIVAELQAEGAGIIVSTGGRVASRLGADDRLSDASEFVASVIPI